MVYQPEEIAVIGAGRGGVEAAIALAKQLNPDGNPRYHIILIEAGKEVLQGASSLAFRVHGPTGFEYPNDDQTARDCLKGTAIWKLLMPDDIFLPTPPMKFLVAAKTQAEGEENPGEPTTSLTVQTYRDIALERRAEYGKIFNYVARALGWSDEQTAKALFGHYNDPSFCRELNPDEYRDYDPNPVKPRIAGGFQSLEPGIDVGKYIALLKRELAALPNITVLTGHTVKSRGIEPKDGQFIIHCENGKDIKAVQVVAAAPESALAIMPPPDASLTEDEKKVLADQLNVKVYRRAMLTVDVPKTWNVPPAFILKGAHGGMLMPEAEQEGKNTKTVRVYLPMGAGTHNKKGKEGPGAYLKDCMLTLDSPELPKNWKSWGEPMAFLVDYLAKNPGFKPPRRWETNSSRVWADPTNNTLAQEAWTHVYFELAKQRFPVLQGTEEDMNPRLEIHNTVSFHTDLSRRRNKNIQPVPVETAPLSSNPTMELLPSQKMEQQMVPEWGEEYAPVQEMKKQHGIYVLSLTKAVYSQRAALEAVSMVNERSDLNKNPDPKIRDREVEAPSNVLDMLLVSDEKGQPDIAKSRANLQKYSFDPQVKQAAPDSQTTLKEISEQRAPDVAFGGQE